MSETVVSIRNLTYFYPGSKKPALKNINLDIYRGEMVLISGASGSGKSTLCKCILGLIPHIYGGHIEGSVNVLGMNVLEHRPCETAKRVGMVFQNPEEQLTCVTVEEDIAFGPLNLGLSRKEVKKRVEEVVKLLGLENLKKRFSDELSSGQQQRVALASILAMEPEILVLDEPTSELDPASAVEFLNWVRYLNIKKKMTIVLTEHRLEHLVPYVDRMFVISNGEIVLQGSVRDVLEQNVYDYGVNVPKVVKLALELRRRGYSFDKIPLTIEEFMNTIRSIMR